MVFYDSMIRLPLDHLANTGSPQWKNKGQTTNFVYGKRVFVDTFERQLLLNLIDIKCPCEDGEKYIETFGQT